MALADWDEDLKRLGLDADAGLTQVGFCEAMFELAELWTAHADPAQLSNFLDQVPCNARRSHSAGRSDAVLIVRLRLGRPRAALRPDHRRRGLSLPLLVFYESPYRLCQIL